MPQVSAALVRSAPSKTIASANIRRDAALSFSRPAAARSSIAVKSLRVTAIAAIVLAPHHTKSSSIQTFSDSGTPTSHPFSPLVSVVTRLSVLCSYLKRWTFKLGHSLNQIRPLGVKTGQYLKGIIPQCMFQQAAEIRTPHITNVNAQAAPIRNLSAI